MIFFIILGSSNQDHNEADGRALCFPFTLFCHSHIRWVFVFLFRLLTIYFTWFFQTMFLPGLCYFTFHCFYCTLTIQLSAPKVSWSSLPQTSTLRALYRQSWSKQCLCSVFPEMALKPVKHLSGWGTELWLIWRQKIRRVAAVCALLQWTMTMMGPLSPASWAQMPALRPQSALMSHVSPIIFQEYKINFLFRDFFLCTQC